MRATSQYRRKQKKRLYPDKESSQLSFLLPSLLY